MGNDTPNKMSNKKSKVQQKDLFKDLPDDCIFIIFNYMPMISLKKIECLSRHIFNLLDKDSVYWKVRGNNLYNETGRDWCRSDCWTLRKFLSIPQANEVFKRNISALNLKVCGEYDMIKDILLSFINHEHFYMGIHFEILKENDEYKRNETLYVGDENFDITNCKTALQNLNMSLELVYKIFDKFRYEKTIISEMKKMGYYLSIDIGESSLEVMLYWGDDALSLYDE